MNKLDVLIISNTLDFGIDLITFGLEKRGVKYFRLNRDKFQEYKITLDIQKKELTIVHNSKKYYVIEKHIKSIYYRAPIYLRDIYKPGLSEIEQLYRTQWSAFVRNLAFFESPIWVNNPENTFRAENKFLQLKYAEKLGFSVPKSIVTNTIDYIKFEKMIIKSVDTALFRSGANEAFVYSNIVEYNELSHENMKELPVIVQELIEPKIDIRVTVIGDRIYAVKILNKGEGISGDWRMLKNQLQYLKVELPHHIEEKCIKLTKLMKLNFSGIDLAKCGDKYFFIELNPTGEWAWMTQNKEIAIDDAICDYLCEL